MERVVACVNFCHKFSTNFLLRWRVCDWSSPPIIILEQITDPHEKYL